MKTYKQLEQEIERLKSLLYRDRDMSPCCNYPLMKFVSGGGSQVSGAYVKCFDCGIDYQIDYKTGAIEDG